MTKGKACAVIRHDALPGVRSTHATSAYKRKRRGQAAPEVLDLIGGADEDRTHDLLNAIQALSQTELRPHILYPRSQATSVPYPRSQATSVLYPRSQATSVLYPRSQATSVKARSLTLRCWQNSSPEAARILLR